MYTKQDLNKMGYSNIQGIDNLVDIWNIIGENYKIENRFFIIADDKLEQINQYIKNNKLKLTKAWDKYKNKFYIPNGVISESKYKEWIVKQKHKVKLEKIQQQEKQRIEEENYQTDLEILNQLKTAYSQNWLNRDWIEAMIGSYDNPFAEYYWTLIGNKGYKVIDWKGNIKIREDIYKQIINDHTFKSYSGKNFLTRSFKNKKGYAAYIEGTYPIWVSDNSGFGIYGIYYEEELIYVGLTQKGFESRWKEHMNIFKGIEQSNGGMILYQQNLDVSKIRFSKLINVNELKFEGNIGLQELKAMELACIEMFQPKYNILGKTKPYII